MGKASARKKYARASSMRTRRRSGGATWFRASVAVVVILGVALVVVSRNERNATALPGPKLTDHWHAALGINVCGKWVPNAPQFTTDHSSGAYAGIHTHNDGIIHMEPQTASDASNNATLGRWFEHGGWTLTTKSLKLWDGTNVKNGDKCQGKRAQLQWFLDGVKQAGDPSKLVFDRNGRVVVLWFGPSTDKVPDPPSKSTLAALVKNPLLTETTIPSAPSTDTSSPPASTATPSTSVTTAPVGTTGTKKP